MSTSAGSKKSSLVALAAAATVLGVAIYSVTRTPSLKKVKPAEQGLADSGSAQNGPPGNAKAGYKEIGGVFRPSTDVEPKFDSELMTLDQQKSQIVNYGTTPLVKANANVHTKSVAEALKSGRNPERLSPSITANVFDAEEWKRDPSIYLATIEPGRVFQPAQPGPDVTRLRMLSPRRLKAEQGEVVPLKVRTEPNSPVTYSSFDLGQFENQLSSITVRADDRGIAIARFTGSSGTLNDVNILAASPVTSGQVKFIVNVTLPKKAGTSVAAR